MATLQKQNAGKNIGLSLDSKLTERKESKINVEAYSVPSQTSQMRFCKNISNLKAVNHFKTNLHVRCLTGFKIRLLTMY